MRVRPNQATFLWIGRWIATKIEIVELLLDQYLALLYAFPRRSHRPAIILV